MFSVIHKDYKKGVGSGSPIEGDFSFSENRKLILPIQFSLIEGSTTVSSQYKDFFESLDFNGIPLNSILTVSSGRSDYTDVGHENRWTFLPHIPCIGNPDLLHAFIKSYGAKSVTLSVADGVVYPDFTFWVRVYFACIDG